MRQIRRHTWLFSFTDIAFLLLLVFTQLAQVKSSAAPVAEMRLPAPVVVENPELKILKTEKDYRQLLVEKHSGKPYRLAHIIGGNEISRGGPLNLDELDAALKGIRGEKTGQPRPVVVPLPESFSSDLLQAAALVGRLWSEPGSAVVHTGRREGKQ
ncbi:MAG TPA: hypothetical protein VEM32_06220 [Geobacteraceae bacterium]|nr:hypothetical protein [Geobacteraceae bacterium]